ncbi:aminodeoxychorismate synthase component I [Biformimicrobium ophioploci]|uniref:aminodeoxychorismate synthase n=1 Tax=Biformimicrobium ophioploci TaxID=3036711 RepID=A0ABQ6M1G4_9GAMM|nr:aminodeoxychorismate synthase component I [Microbulbifer sp. NKW57]GMG88195.1 aminodeoxychorismate synthase component I [Microbulbifer sp. NKW57]
MKSLKIFSLPYHENSAPVFHAFSDMPCPVWLDSAKPGSPSGRFDIIAADPVNQVALDADAAASFSPVDDLLCELQPLDATPQLPFSGGIIGFAGYETGAPLNHLSPDTRATPLPTTYFGLYLWAVIVDHQLRSSHLVIHPAATPVQVSDIQARVATIDWQTDPRMHLGGFQLRSQFAPVFDRGAYGHAFRKLQQYIHAGDIYQANLTQEFRAAFSGNPFSAYLALREATPAPFSAYIDLPTGQILSVSPERFVLTDGEQVESRPIKGTAPRGASAIEDARLAADLQASIKDRAENLMIVDLLRNDIGKICRKGSVQVPQLFGVESYANVHHLVSIVTGRMGEDQYPTDLLDACFPGGSITGAPKRRAMEIIRELESGPRGVYCGSIGYVSVCGRSDTSIAIRTLTCADGQVHCWGGGGIVADSDEESEYQESLIKVRKLMTTLESFLSTSR